MTPEELRDRLVELGTIRKMACRSGHKTFFLEGLISFSVWKTDLLIFLGVTEKEDSY